MNQMQKASGQNQMTAKQFIQSQEKQIMAALPETTNSKTFMRLCLTELSRNPKLQMCTSISLLGSFIEIAQLGLSPDSTMQECHLIPYGDKCTVQLNYRGLIKLATNDGRISHIEPFLIHENDTFDYQMGFKPKLTHKLPPFGEDRGEIIGAYAVAHLRQKTAVPPHVVMTKKEIEAIRDRKQKTNPIWNSDYGEMAKKTAIRRLCKLLPKTTELAQALAIEDREGDPETIDVENNVPQIQLTTDQATTPKKEIEAGEKAAKAIEVESLKSKFKTWAKDIDAEQAGVNEKEILDSDEPKKIRAAINLLMSHKKKQEQANEAAETKQPEPEPIKVDDKELKRQRKVADFQSAKERFRIVAEKAEELGFDTEFFQKELQIDVIDLWDLDKISISNTKALNKASQKLENFFKSDPKKDVKIEWTKEGVDELLPTPKNGNGGETPAATLKKVANEFVMQGGRISDLFGNETIGDMIIAGDKSIAQGISTIEAALEG